MSRFIAKATLVGVSAVAGYYGYEHWRKIRIYPEEARKELRDALRAINDGRSGDAEKCLHNALSICVRIHGESSVGFHP